MVRIRIEASLSLSISLDSTSVTVHPDGIGALKNGTEGRELLKDLGPMPEGLPLLMDRAYEGNETRQLVLELGMVPVVPPKSNRVDPWRYDRALNKKRNEIERLFRRLNGYCRIFSRFDKLDCDFLAFLCFALIVEALR